MDDLSRFEHLRNQASHYDEIRKACETGTVRWEWSNGPIWSPEPGYLELNGFLRGAAIAGPPADLNGAYCYGWGAEGRCHVIRQYVEFPGHFYEMFFIYEPDGIAQFHYSHQVDKPWINIGWFDVSDGSVVRFSSVSAEGRKIVDEYTHDALGRPLARTRTQPNARYALDVEHDDRGMRC